MADDTQQVVGKPALAPGNGQVELSDISGLKRIDSQEFLALSIHQCARDGDTDVMIKLLQSLPGNVKRKLNAVDEENVTPLHYAARYNHHDVCKVLVDAGAVVNCVDGDGASPLHYAARYKRMRFTQNIDQITDNAENDQDTSELTTTDAFDFESTEDNSVIIFLVSRGGDVNFPDNYRCTPLHYAAMRGNEIATKELLSCKAIQIEAEDDQQMTALHMAASHNEILIAQMLIERGANIRCTDEDNSTPLHYASAEGSLQVVEMLLAASVKNKNWVSVDDMLSDEDTDQNTPLHLAVENQSLEVAKLCISKGANVNATRNNYITPLHLAAITGDLDLVKLLIENHARIDALDLTQSTPLHKAAAYNHDNICQFLISRGAKLHKRDKDNFSPLLIAASNGHATTIKTLLRRGAKLTDVDKNDKTAIYWAAEEDNQEALKVILENPRGKRLLEMSDRYDDTPLHVAASKGYLRIVKDLLAAGADIDAKNENEETPLHLAAKHGKTAVVKALVNFDIHVINDEDEDTNTALHLAAQAGHTKVVLALIEAGANCEARNYQSWTPLDCAADNGWVKTCRVLLEADAPVDPRDKSKITPLHLASQKGHVDCVNLLIQWNASVSLVDKNGNNCLDMAIDSGNTDVAQAIVNSKNWRNAMRNVTKDGRGNRLTPLRKLINKMPSVAEVVFTRCTKTNGLKSDQTDYKITFDYEFLDDNYANWTQEDLTSDSSSFSGEIYDEDGKLLDKAKLYSPSSRVLKANHTMSTMVNANREDLLAHPLVISLLKHKWKNYGRYVYYSNLVLYSIFLVFLTSYIVLTTPPYKLFDGEPVLSKNYSCDNVLARYTATNRRSQLTVSTYVMACRYIVMIFAIFNVLREIFQIFNSGFWGYIGYENLMEWFIAVTSFLTVFDFNNCQQTTGIREAWQWQMAAACIFFAWLDLVLFVRKLPGFGIYVVMFVDILVTFIKFLPVLLLFIIAFALGFWVLLGNQFSFREPQYSLIKSVVMMIGEFEFTNIFLGLEDIMDPYSREAHTKTVYYSPLAYTLFILFISMMTILIMNLLVGLAVDDIKSVQDQAVLKRLAMQVNLVLDVESVLPEFMRRRFFTKYLHFEPNKNHNFFTRNFNILADSSSLNLPLNPEDEKLDILEENQTKLISDVKQLRYRVKNMSQQNERLENMLKAIIKAQNIEFEEEDAQEEEGSNK